MKKGKIILLILILISLSFVFAYPKINQEEKITKNMEAEYYDKNISLDQATNNLINDFREERDLYLDPKIRNQIRLKYVNKLKILKEKYFRKWENNKQLKELLEVGK